MLSIPRIQLLSSRHFVLKFLVNSRWLLIFASLLAIDWLLYSKLSAMFPADDDEQQLEEMRPLNYQRVTINQLIANLSVPLKVLGKIPNRHDRNEHEKDEFTYQKLHCKSKMLVKGKRNRFQICYPPHALARQPDRLAYFINGPRDNEFERNFKKILIKNTQLKVFTRHNNATRYAFRPDLAKDVDVKIYTEETEDANGRPVMGIKDLLDAHDDYHSMEFIKYEMNTTTDPIVFSINIPVFVAHILVRLENFSYEEFRYLVKRLNYSLYYPYAVVHNRQWNVHFLSLMHKFHIHKYEHEEIAEATYTRKQHEQQERELLLL